MAANTRLLTVFLQDVAQCLMRLVEARTTADGLDALSAFLQGLPAAWHAVDIFSGAEQFKRVASYQCPRGLAAFVSAMGFLKRQDGTYQGTFAKSTLILVKSARPWAGDRSLVCAAGFEKDSPFNDGATTACIGALIQAALSRVLSIEATARRIVALDGCVDHDEDVVAIFDAFGRLVEQFPAEGRPACPPALFQGVAAQALGHRSRAPRPMVLSADGRLFDVRSHWVSSDRTLDSRYLFVYARTRPSVPRGVVEKLKDYALSPRESQVAERLFVGQSNQVIAESLRISRDTVKTHCRHIFGKLGISRRTEFLRMIGETSPAQPTRAARGGDVSRRAAPGRSA